MRSFEESLQLYAELTIKAGLGLMPGQELIITADLDQAPLVRRVAEAAYREGAKHVEVLWKDPELARIRFEQGSDEAIDYAPKWFYNGLVEAYQGNAARLGIVSGDPAQFAKFPADRVFRFSTAQSIAGREVSRFVSELAINWCLIGGASPEWAQRIFPEMDVAAATERLWNDIFATSRVNEPDPTAAWIRHCEGLEAKVVWLNERQFEAVRFEGPGTDLRVGLVKNHLWAGGRSTAKNGAVCACNVPTEEVFTMPHRERVNGVVSSTKPLSLRGQVVDGIRMEFRDGVAVHVSAERGEDALHRFLATDEGAKRLGEVALVPNSSKVAETGTLFFNTLYDENASCHIAMGQSYSENLAGIEAMSESELLAYGANTSDVHSDWMIGSGEIQVFGVHDDGTEVPLLRDGEWVF